MTPHERQNTLTWLHEQIHCAYASIIKESYPALVGLPLDDGGDIVSMVLDDMADDELEAMLRLGEEQLAVWIRGRVEEEVDGWFRDDAEEALSNHVGDLLMDHPGITDDDVRLALSYLKQRSSTIDLVNRFEDPPEQWLKLIDLAKRESESGS